YQACW
ncbi:cell division FtsX domain protein, partial [Vibrio parahaemolyticus V-223/04]